jgi:hypothetical protein
LEDFAVSLLEDLVFLLLKYLVGTLGLFIDLLDFVDFESDDFGDLYNHELTIDSEFSPLEDF